MSGDESPGESPVVWKYNWETHRRRKYSVEREPETNLSEYKTPMAKSGFLLNQKPLTIKPYPMKIQTKYNNNRSKEGK